MLLGLMAPRSALAVRLQVFAPLWKWAGVALWPSTASVRLQIF